MSSKKRFFVLFHCAGKYLMVSEWTSNPGQLIIINYWQRKWLEYYQISWRFLWEISLEGYDDLGSHMVGRWQTLRLENFNFNNIAKCTAVSTIYKEIAGLIIGSEISRTWLFDCVVPEEEGLHRICALELWADKADLTLENWYELASNIPGHNAIEFDTWQLEIYEISAFLKATRKLALAFVSLQESCVVWRACHLL